MFWAANNYHARTGTEKAAKGTLAEEQLLNETADVRIIGVTLETRPDSITGVEVRKNMIVFFYIDCMTEYSTNVMIF